MTDLLPPGDVPAPSASEAGVGWADFWQSDFWPALWPKLVLNYATAAARTADLTGLGPSDRAFSFLEDSKTLWRWTGSTWGLAAPWVQSGTVSLVGDDTNLRSVSVVFPVPFTATPGIQLSLLTGASSSLVTCHLWATSPTATGCNVNGIRNNSTTMIARWTATLNP